MYNFLPAAHFKKVATVATKDKMLKRNIWWNFSALKGFTRNRFVT